ncbi:MAG: aspartate carbamoyltransferase catalytic subunit, partial [Caldimonas sp.]
MLSRAVAGDDRHHRHPHGDAEGHLRQDHALRAVGPKTLVPGDLKEMGVRVCHDMAEGIRGADVIIMLRLQNERMS